MYSNFIDSVDCRIHSDLYALLNQIHILNVTIHYSYWNKINLSNKSFSG